jgi:diadenosine tetraphosphate (Ap4A) HIT family hydrolase
MLEIKSFNEVPWKDISFENEWYSSFHAPVPISPGHLIYVPKDTQASSMAIALKAALEVGEFMVKSKKWDGFNLGINYGEAAGQNTNYPHAHLIPRFNGDKENPKGGIKTILKS